MYIDDLRIVSTQLTGERLLGGIMDPSGGSIGKAAGELMKEMQQAQEQLQKLQEQQGGADGASFQDSMQAQQAQHTDATGASGLAEVFSVIRLAEPPKRALLQL